MHRNSDNMASRTGLLCCGILAAVAAATPMAANADDAVTAWADDVAQVDSTEFRTVVGTAAVRCSPKWLSSEAGASYSLSVVTNPGTTSEATSTVGAASTTEDDVDYAGSGYVRFVLKVSVDGVEVGETLVQDVSFGVVSDSCAPIAADSRAASLQERIRTAGAADVAYSTEWASGTESVSVSVIGLSGKGGDATGTNMVFSTSSAAEDYAAVRGLDPGWWKLLYRAVDSSGATVLEYVTDEFRARGGLVLSVW